MESRGETRAQLITRAKRYAKTVSLPLDHSRVSWELSERARRRAGQCLYNARTGAVTIRLTWAAFEAYGWEQFSGVVRHELVHAWEFQQFGESNHGPRFKQKVREIDAPHTCERFTDARLILSCVADACDWRAERHRASKVVRNPTNYRCGACHSRLRITHVETGDGWQSHEGYERARTQIGDDW